MIVVEAFRDKTVAVLGLARSGLAAARALMAGGARVLAWDDGAERRALAETIGVGIADLAGIDWTTVSAFVVSPGVPLTHPAPHPLVVSAWGAGVPVMGDVELFHLARAGLPSATVIAVTGTNGKSTTTALIGHVLGARGLAVAVGGNIGTALLDLDPVPEGGFYVLELSSYQIDLTERFQADVAVLLNITPDHLERHGDMAGYTRAKERLFLRQAAGQTAVIGVDDAHGIRFAEHLGVPDGPKVVRISGAYVTGGGVAVRDGILLDGIKGLAVPVGNLAGAADLRGAHNGQNAAAAYAVARAVGIPATVIFNALMTFPGLEHRMERVAICDGIEFVNDSKATNLDAAAKALGAFETIYWIAGGRPKTTDLITLAPYFSRVRRAYLIGEAAQGFSEAMTGQVDHVIAGDLVTAVRMATNDAMAAGGPAVVLLSPACASFDQFADFEDRGRTFARLVGESRRCLAPEVGA